MMTRLCIVLTALAVIARARVAVLPGWVVPLPALILAAAITVCVTVLARLMLHVLQDRHRPGYRAHAVTPGTVP